MYQYAASDLIDVSRHPAMYGSCGRKLAGARRLLAACEWADQLLIQSTWDISKELPFVMKGISEQAENPLRPQRAIGTMSLKEAAVTSVVGAIPQSLATQVADAVVYTTSVRTHKDCTF